MNPNGIVFGQNARLDIGGSFHATTGTGLGFENGTFNVDKNSLSFPSGDPKTIRFAVSQPTELINQGNLAIVSPYCDHPAKSLPLVLALLLRIAVLILAIGHLTFRILSLMTGDLSQESCV